MRVRVRKTQHRRSFTCGTECQRCGQRRFGYSWEEVIVAACKKCGGIPHSLILGRFDDPLTTVDGRREADRRVAAHRAAAQARVEAGRPRKLRARLAKRKDSAMAKVLKIKRRRDEEEEEVVRPAKGKVKTGTKVEKVRAGKGQPGSSEGRLLGVRSGLSIAKYQNKTIEENRKKKLTDEQLAADWRREFPGARAEYTADTVRGVRNAFNRGAHGNEAPAKPIPQFDDDGEALPFRGEKAAAKREEAEERQAEARRVKKVKKSK